MVHEVEYNLQVSELHPLEVEERVLVRVLLENGSEERRAGRQDELVCLDLSGATAKSAVKEVLLLPDLPEGQANVALKIIPTETELFICPHDDAADGKRGLKCFSYAHYLFLGQLHLILARFGLGSY